MDGAESVLDAILDVNNAEEYEDAEMVDVEEGELVEENLNAGEGELVEENLNAGEGDKKKKKRRKKKNKKNKRKSFDPERVDVDKFVMDTCKHLKERKSYLVYAAVGCLGVSAVNDLVNEVDVIQACGGQKTSDGMRFRYGGGILLNILKTRDPNAYKEIMKKAREFEKQFKFQSIKKPEPALPCVNQSTRLESDMLIESERPKAAESLNNEPVKFTGGEKRTSVHNRLRVPVSYSDLLEEENLDGKKVPELDSLHNESLLSSPGVV